ncbi:MAG: T9SS type A sorting domain-containing protein [Flavobacteriales bacterium]|nr:T9SS type A sorting domain-containing protein [Flavobacteriales bacterium]
MGNNYKESSESNRLKGLKRVSVIIVMIMVWILIDKGNIYGQTKSIVDQIEQNEGIPPSGSTQSRGDDDDPRVPETDDEDQVTVSPNPFTKDLVFDFEFTVKMGIPYDVVDPLGRLAESGVFRAGISTQYLDLSHLKNGMYLVRLNLGNKMKVLRVLKR